jgi:hypothetical protein
MNEENKPSAEEQYAEEILCANWNPLVSLAQPLARVQQAVLDAADAENLLARLYACQQA